jgi:formylglycine-generating enzyme required for sulfatase activity
VDALIGAVVSHYRILEQIGAGGMGVVYLAEDERLQRKVALKFIAPESAGESIARRRLLREAQAASALDHPNIATVYEVGDFQDQLFLAMAYYAGETLKQRIERGPLATAEAIRVTEQIGEGLAAAHASGVVHRDLKPANVFITTAGQVKILDFGLATVDASDTAQTTSAITQTGTTLGTLSYMSPEQARGERVEQRADVWALGVLIFEMFTGRLPFRGDSATAVLLALATKPAPPLSSLRPDAPSEFGRLVERALVKDAAHRTLTAHDVARVAAQCRERATSVATPSLWTHLRRPAIAVPLGLLLAAGIAGATVAVSSGRNRQWARYTALPEALRLAEQQNFIAAVELTTKAEGYLGKDSDVDGVWARIARPLTLNTDPPGVTISYADYARDAEWRTLGVTPLKDAHLPQGVLRLKAEKAGFETAEDVTFTGAGARPPSFTLSATGTAPPDMVRATAAQRFPIYVLGLESTRVNFNAFWIDRYEVSNRNYKAFVDAGGYKRPEFWRYPFVKDGQTLSFDAAMALLSDATGRPGPAAWALGSFPEGDDALPVTGVSWYEAAAYAAFAGRNLPTVYHWYWVATQGLTSVILPVANFSAPGPVRASEPRALHRFGAYNLAGNVKEWSLNEAPDGRRYILGGGWDEPPHQFRDPDARSPFDRARNFGFRTVKYDDGDASVAALEGLLLSPMRDYRLEKPASDEVLRAYERVYSYDSTDLAAKVESVDDSAPEWRVEQISIAAAYGQERFTIQLLLPRTGTPPFQTVLYLPAGGAWDQRASPPLINPLYAFLLRSGRAVAAPVFKGTYERSDPTLGDKPKITSAWRDSLIMFAKDFGRSVDYLTTRTDIDASRLAVIGASRGASLSPLVLGREPRIKAAALWIPGLYREKLAPEVDPFNFVSRVTMPVLQLSGRYDYTFADESQSRPFFEELGTPPDRKRRVVYNTGHNLPPNEAVKETLDWFDLYLGPVR